MRLVTGSAASLPIIISLSALLNEVGDQAVRFGTASHSGELVPAGGEVQPALPTEAANQTATDFNKLFEEKSLIEINPRVSKVRTPKSPHCSVVALSELCEGLPLSQPAHGAGTVSRFLNQSVV